MEHPTDRQAVVAFVARLLQISSENQAVIKKRADLDAIISSNNARLADCEAGLRALGYDLSQEGVWPKLYETSMADVQAYFDLQLGNTNSIDTSPPPMTLTDTRAVSPQSSIAKLLLERLEEIGSKGSKALPLRDWLRKTHNLETHYKTVGMTLYRLSQDSPPKVHRKGHTWFFGPPNAEAENPGVTAPGQINADVEERKADGDLHPT